MARRRWRHVGQRRQRQGSPGAAEDSGRAGARGGGAGVSPASSGPAEVTAEGQAARGGRAGSGVGERAREIAGAPTQRRRPLQRSRLLLVFSKVFIEGELGLRSDQAAPDHLPPPRALAHLELGIEEEETERRRHLWGGWKGRGRCQRGPRSYARAEARKNTTRTPRRAPVHNPT